MPTQCSERRTQLAKGVAHELQLTIPTLLVAGTVTLELMGLDLAVTTARTTGEDDGDCG